MKIFLTVIKAGKLITSNYSIQRTSNYVMAQRSITSFFAPISQQQKATLGDDSVKSIPIKDEEATKNKAKPKNKPSPQKKAKTPRAKSASKKSPAPKLSKTKLSSPLDKENKKIASTASSKRVKSPVKIELTETPSEPEPKKKRRRAIIESDSSDEDVAAVEEKTLKTDNETVKEETDESKAKTENEEQLQEEVDSTNNSPSSSGKRRSSPLESEAKKPKSSPTIKKATSKSPPSGGKTIASFFGMKNNDNKEKDADGVQYNPTLKKYHPIDDAVWQHSEKVPYIALARTLEEIENVSARLRMIEILSNYFRSVIVLSPADLLPSVYLCLNKLAPAYEGLELGVAEGSLMKAIAQSTGRTLAQIKADAQKVGDLGVVAEQSRSNQRMIFQASRLHVRGVFEKLKEIASMSGSASQTKKVEKIQSMFVACRHSEARFLIRSLLGKLRIGLAEQSVLQALALACTLTPPNQDHPPAELNLSKSLSAERFKSKYDENTLILKTTYCECPNYDKIVAILLREGIENLPHHCKLTPGIPLKPMLAQPTKGVHEILHRFENLKFTCEWKYDGERAQIHITADDTISIYSRNQENNTSKYPDIIKRLHGCKSEEVKSCILDCEAVAWDTQNKQILPFQILSTRKRKDAKEEEIKVQVCIFLFDLLYFNGEPLVRKPFSERRSLLKQHFKEVEGECYFAKYLDTSTMEEVQEFLEESVKGKCEGLMVKTLEEEATYEIAKRSRNWLKLKKDYLDGVGDTLDVVCIGGYMGKGKRTGTYGGFLLACYDKDNEEYQCICKIGTGFSDDDLQKHTEFFKNHIIDEPKPYYRFDAAHQPDHWFDAVQVWEIKCADLSLSPVYHAAIGIVDAEKGVSLRFPRFIRVREDKGVEEATSAQQIADMYHNQDQVKDQGGSNKTKEEDFY